MEVSRKGSLLEKTLADIFNKAGFNVEINSKKFGFETDVLVTKGSFKIIVEAKQYENSYLNIGSLLHEWSSKGKSVNADRILIVITGIKINKKFFQLAKKLGIYLWGEDIYHELIGIEENEKLCHQICSYLQFGKVMARLAQIENSNLYSNQVFKLQNQARTLGELEFKKDLTSSVKEKKEKEKSIKIQQKIFEENLRNAKKKAKILRGIKTGLVVAGILFIFFCVCLAFNELNEKLNNPLSENNLIFNSDGQQLDYLSQGDFKEEFLDFCKAEFKGISSYTELKNYYYFENYLEASEWIDSVYPNEGLTLNRARFFKEEYLDKSEFPVYIFEGARKIDSQILEQGYYICDKTGIILNKT